MTSPDFGALRAAATAAKQHAYAPYSQFRVGAALLSADGRVFTGCNVENSSYPVGICAERAAVATAVAAGQQRFTALVIVSEAETPTSPCGMCRQVLVEFAPTLPIRSYGAAGVEGAWTLDALLAAPFTGDSLRHA